MAATLKEIKGWLSTAKDAGATHLIVICDTWDFVDYPLRVMSGKDPSKVTLGEGERIEECYALHLNIESQLREHRALHFEMAP